MSQSSNRPYSLHKLECSVLYPQKMWPLSIEYWNTQTTASWSINLRIHYMLESNTDYCFRTVATLCISSISDTDSYTVKRLMVITHGQVLIMSLSESYTCIHSTHADTNILYDSMHHCTMIQMIAVIHSYCSTVIIWTFMFSFIKSILETSLYF